MFVFTQVTKKEFDTEEELQKWIKDVSPLSFDQKTSLLKDGFVDSTSEEGKAERVSQMTTMTEVTENDESASA